MTIKDFVFKLIAFAICGIVFLYSFIGYAIVTHAAVTDVITVTFTKEDLRNLLANNVEHAFYTNITNGYESNLKRDWVGNYGADVNYEAIYKWSPDAMVTTAGQVIYQFVFPFSAYALSSQIQLAVSNSNLNAQIWWMHADPSIDFWNFDRANTVTYSSGLTLTTMDYSWQGNMDMSSFHISFDSVEPEIVNSLIFGIRSLSITYDKLTFDNIVKQLEEQNIILEGIQQAQEELNDKLTNPTEEDKNDIADLEQNMQDTQDKADEYNEAMDSVETPEPDEVVPEESVDQIYNDENVTEGQPYIFSILESLQSITWILTMILISVTVGIIKYIIYGKT